MFDCHDPQLLSARSLKVDRFLSQTSNPGDPAWQWYMRPDFITLSTQFSLHASSNFENLPAQMQMVMWHTMDQSRKFKPKQSRFPCCSWFIVKNFSEGQLSPKSDLS